jgi:hypothetical protein
MDWLHGIYEYATSAWNWLVCFFPHLMGAIQDVAVLVYKELVSMMITVMGVIPIPESVQNMSFQVIPPEIGWAIDAFDLPIALGMIAAAAGVRLTMSVLKVLAIL